MLQQLALATGAQNWAIAAMLFFLLVFVVVVVRVLLTRDEIIQRCARLPLDEPELVTTSIAPRSLDAGSDSGEA